MAKYKIQFLKVERPGCYFMIESMELDVEPNRFESLQRLISRLVELIQIQPKPEGGEKIGPARTH